jgi:hypothetical protein
MVDQDGQKARVTRLLSPRDFPSDSLRVFDSIHQQLGPSSGVRDLVNGMAHRGSGVEGSL